MLRTFVDSSTEQWILSMLTCLNLDCICICDVTTLCSMLSVHDYRFPITQDRACEWHTKNKGTKTTTCPARFRRCLRAVVGNRTKNGKPRDIVYIIWHPQLPPMMNLLRHLYPIKTTTWHLPHVPKLLTLAASQQWHPPRLQQRLQAVNTRRQRLRCDLLLLGQRPRLRRCKRRKRAARRTRSKRAGTGTHPPERL